MKKVKRRTMSLMSLILAIAVGMSFYVYLYWTEGENWASFISNSTVFKNGQLAVGTVYDRNGMVLAAVRGDEREYNDSSLIRKATLHAVGDRYGNIGTGALTAFAPQLIGYDPINGAYSVDGTGGKLTLSIDADLCAEAYEALDGRKGAIGVMNYVTGEIVCMTSGASYDPYDPPDSFDSDYYEGVYINRLLSAAYTPGSVFKLVTLTAAIETMPDLFDRTFTCEGSVEIDGDWVTCTGYHGEIGIEEALAVSCNCAFARLALDLGGETLAKYAERLGVTQSHDINGLPTMEGVFEIAPEGSCDLAWSGIGQYDDQVNPAAMMRLSAAIANGGRAVAPTLIKGESGGGERIMSGSTADKIAEMMNYNVHYTYGVDNYPGLELYAKSGTAEVGSDRSPHAWFTGFIRDKNHPYAFVVMIENGGGGSSQAGAAANRVLQAAVSK